jgi:hypothetical protein
MNEFMICSICGMALCAIIGISCGIWRVNFMLKDPEGYDAFRQREIEYEERMKANMGWHAGNAKKAGSAALTGAKIVYKVLKK